MQFHQQARENNYAIVMASRSLVLSNHLNNKYMYFIHSYHSIPEEKIYISSTSKFEKEEFVSSIKSQNLFAFQFHPEKSGENGMKIIRFLITCLPKTVMTFSVYDESHINLLTKIKQI